MALPASDAFTDTDGVQLTTHNTSFTLQTGDFDIQSNALSPDSGNSTKVLARWNADTFDNDQYAALTLIARLDCSYSGIGPAVRVSSGAVTSYQYYVDRGSGYLSKFVAGTETSLSESSYSLSVPALNAVLRIEASGTTITALIDGATTGAPTPQTDNAIASGSGGIGGWTYATISRTNMRMDNWAAGNLGGGATGNPYYAFAQQM